MGVYFDTISIELISKFFQYILNFLYYSFINVRYINNYIKMFIERRSVYELDMVSTYCNCSIN